MTLEIKERKLVSALRNWYFGMESLLGACDFFFALIRNWIA